MTGRRCTALQLSSTTCTPSWTIDVVCRLTGCLHRRSAGSFVLPTAILDGGIQAFQVLVKEVVHLLKTPGR